MVQRKVPNKLGIQVDHDKTKNGLSNVKPEISQHQDGRYKGGLHLKMKMKKSGSIKLLDNESTSLPGKPLLPAPPPQPTTDKISVKAAMQRKKYLIKTSVGSPNYMKSTSSSKARMERALMTQTGSNTESSSQQKLSGSKTDSSLIKKQMRGLTRSPSLKRTRSLKKTLSFNHANLQGKKWSKVNLCADMNIQRATCSSTLKDTKFPSYLTLNPGGTELDGTSIMKVCPYTYCSLNGHFHTPSPPLKTFLSAKRHLLKAEKMKKLGALSPRANELDNVPSSREEDYVLINGGDMDFFIEIYDGSGIDPNGDDRENIDRIVKMEGFNELAKIPTGNTDDGLTEINDERDAESLPNESPHFEVNYNDGHLDGRFDIIIAGIGTSKFSHEESKEEYTSFSTHEESTMKYTVNTTNEEDDQQSAKREMDKPDCDAFDMKWEERQHMVPCFDKEDLDTTQLVVNENHDSIEMIKSELDDGSNSPLEEIVADAVVQDELYLDFDMDASVSQASDGRTDAKLAFSSVEESTTTDEHNEADSASMEGPHEELIDKNTPSEDKNVVQYEILNIIGPEPEPDDTNCTTIESEEPILVDDQALDGDTQSAHKNQSVDHFCVDKVCEQTSFEEYKVDDAIKKNEAVEVASYECLLQKIEDSDALSNAATDSFGLKQHIPHTEIEDAGENSNDIDDTKSLSDTHTSDPTQACSEIDLEHSVEDETKRSAVIQDCQDDANVAEFQLDQTFAVPAISSVNRDQASDSKLANHKDAEDQKCSEKDHTEAETSSDHTEEHVNLGTSAVFSTGEVADCSIGGEMGNASYARMITNQDEPGHCKSLKLTINSKKQIMDGDDERNFNPQEPNYLPMTPDPEAEKVDLRHQMEDERKNAEEWMLDYALRQAVTKLAPARSKRVALLVEAFETVKPSSKYETDVRHTSATFGGVRPLQTCI